MTWYLAVSKPKSLRQVVLEIPAGNSQASKFGTLMLGPKYYNILTVPRAIGSFKLGGDSATYILAKGDSVVEKLRNSTIRLAFSFYRMAAAGLFSIAVDNQDSGASSVSDQKSDLFETLYGLDDPTLVSRTTDLISGSTIRICFAHADEPFKAYGGIVSGEAPSAKFDVVIDAPPDYQRTLKAEFTQLLQYHASVPTHSRSFERAGGQWNAENPENENPILQAPKESSTPKRWWQFWA